MCLTPHAPTADLASLLDKAAEFRDASHAARTRDAYSKEWAQFKRWCETMGLEALPAHPGTVAAYVTHLATTPPRDRWGRVRDARGRSPAGISVALAAIAHEHEHVGEAGPHHHPYVKHVLEGIARRWAVPPNVDMCHKPGTRLGPCTVECEHDQCRIIRGRASSPCSYCAQEVGYAVDFYVFGDRFAHADCHDRRPAGQKAPLLANDVRALVATQVIGAPPRDAEAGRRRRVRAEVRNRALFLLHFVGAFRRSEIAALTAEQVEFCEQGLRIRMRKSKTDQLGRKKRLKVLPFDGDQEICPVRALRAWLDESDIRSGPIFPRVDRWGNMGRRMTGHAVAAITKHWAGVAGLDTRNISGHSPRVGFATVAARKRKPLDKIMDQMGHTTVTTLMGYVRDAEAFDDAAAAGLF